MGIARRSGAGSALAVLAVTLGCAAESPQEPPEASAVEFEQGLAPGLSYTTETIGEADAPQEWTLAVLVPDQPSGTEHHLAEEGAARRTAEAVREAGFPADAEAVHWPQPSDGPEEVLGWRVRTGTYDSRDGAEEDAQRLDEAGFSATAQWTARDHDAPPGPTRVHVAVLDPSEFTGRLTGSYGEALGVAETTATMAGEETILAVNAGYFVTREEYGIPGTPTGLTFIDGAMRSEASNGRSALVLEGDGTRPRFAHLSSVLSVHAAEASREIDGLNRRAGTIRNCGGVGGDEPTEAPRHDATCTDEDELVLLTPELGVDTHEVSGGEAVLDAQDRVVQLREPGGPIPEGSRVLQGIGEGADWLHRHAAVGTRLDIEVEISDAETGEVLETEAEDTILNGGPRLLRDGEVAVDVVADGIAHPDDPSFLYTWGMIRNPRQLVGTDPDGRMFLVTVDGRQPGYSAGFGLIEAAEYLASLGAVEGMALDGGGSATMVVNGDVVNSPSDDDGQRPVSDALLILPGE
jgi:hypothetical protein